MILTKSKFGYSTVFRFVMHFCFNCGSGPENGHEVALDLLYGADFGCPVGTGLGAKFGRKPALNQKSNYSFHYIFSAKVI